MSDDQVPIDRVDPQDVLERLARLPIGVWRYRWEGRSIRHVGPLARDFADAFGVDADDRMVNLQDASGVALASLKALNERLEDLTDRVARLEATARKGDRG